MYVCMYVYMYGWLVRLIGRDEDRRDNKSWCEGLCYGLVGMLEKGM